MRPLEQALIGGVQGTNGHAQRLQPTDPALSEAGPRGLGPGGSTPRPRRRLRLARPVPGHWSPPAARSCSPTSPSKASAKRWTAPRRRTPSRGRRRSRPAPEPCRSRPARSTKWSTPMCCVDFPAKLSVLRASRPRSPPRRAHHVLRAPPHPRTRRPPTSPGPTGRSRRRRLPPPRPQAVRAGRVRRHRGDRLHPRVRHHGPARRLSSSTTATTTPWPSCSAPPRSIRRQQEQQAPSCVPSKTDCSADRSSSPPARTLSADIRHGNGGRHLGRR